METEVKDYIKNMFVAGRPAWDVSYEGVLLYDTENNVWIGGDSIGWVEFREE